MRKKQVYNYILFEDVSLEALKELLTKDFKHNSSPVEQCTGRVGGYRNSGMYVGDFRRGGEVEAFNYREAVTTAKDKLVNEWANFYNYNILISNDTRYDTAKNGARVVSSEDKIHENAKTVLIIYKKVVF